MEKISFIKPEWPALASVRAYTTTRYGGYSNPPFATFNLADHVGDDPQTVAANRTLLRETLQLPAEPFWLKQVHSTQVVSEETVTISHHASLCATGDNADASYTTAPGKVCVVLTADCLPVLFCDRAATCVAAAHAGWRGLAAGILEATVYQLAIAPENLMAWLGPAIGAHAFEVGEEVRESFVQHSPQAIQAFTATQTGRWHADLYLLARQRLAQQGITAIYGGKFCTFNDSERFYSYRRDKVTGRIASLIWLAD